MTAAASRRLPYVIAIIWALLTISLASWWLVVGLNLTRQLDVNGTEAVPAVNFRRMFISEGAVFIALLLAGGVAIVVAIRREHLRRHALETFFMSFTHDLKTALASVQLQAEGLLEDWPDRAPRAPLDRLLGDTVRLQIQLENSLFVAQPDGRLLAEPIQVGPAVARLAGDWPGLDLKVTGEASALADARGFDAIVRNLLQNAVVHGGARHVDVVVTAGDTGRVRLLVTDDGRGVVPELLARLGQPFTRSGPTSGSGVGLFVCRQLAVRMGGTLTFARNVDAGRGFTANLDLPGAR